jgi:hypothetical protein
MFLCNTISDKKRLVLATDLYNPNDIRDYRVTKSTLNIQTFLYRLRIPYYILFAQLVSNKDIDNL